MAIEIETETPASSALTSGFKITQAYLWDDAVVDLSDASSARVHHLDSLAEESISLHGPASLTTIRSDINPITNSIAVSLEDEKLAKEMSELGLPISFSTNKEKRFVTTKEKRKGPRPKSLSGPKHIREGLVEVSRVSEGDNIVSPIVCQDNSSTSVCNIEMNDHSDTSHCCLAEDGNKQQFLSGEGHCQGQAANEVIGAMTEYSMDRNKIPDGSVIVSNVNVAVDPVNFGAASYPAKALQVTISDLHHEAVDKSQGEDLEGSAMARYDAVAGNGHLDSSELSQSDWLDSHGQVEFDGCEKCSDSGDWVAVWDAFYMRFYFYNFRTNESTWYPPPGMESPAYFDGAAEFSEKISDSAEDEVEPGSAFDGVKNTDRCRLEDSGDLFQEVKNDDSLSASQSKPILSFGNVMSCPAQPKTRVNCMHLGELEGKINCSENQKNYDKDLCLSPFHPSLDIQNYTHSLSNIINLSGSEDVCRSDVQLGFMNSKTDELCVLEHLCKPEEDITSMKAKKLSSDGILQDAESLTVALTEACSDETREIDMQLPCMNSTVDDLGDHHSLNAIKKKKTVRRRSQKKILSHNSEGIDLQGMLEGFTVDIAKYWCQRYFLFSRFDDGVKMDEEGWFSITPEAIARHHASRCGNGTIIDCFTGVGGNAIQFAMRCNHVIAIDIDPQKIDYAHHNATVYGVNEKIDFIKGDFFQLASKLKGDTVFMSPPWGGPDYAKVSTYDISTMLKPHDGYFLFKIAMSIASRIVMFLPRNVDLNQLIELCQIAHPPWELEVCDLGMCLINGSKCEASELDHQVLPMKDTFLSLCHHLNYFCQEPPFLSPDGPFIAPWSIGLKVKPMNWTINSLICAVCVSSLGMLPLLRSYFSDS